MDTFPSDFTIQHISTIKPSHRYIAKEISTGNLELCLVGENRIANSNQVFNSFLSSIETILESLTLDNTKVAQQIADDYLHNIKKIHGNQKNIVERCIYGAEGQENYSDFVKAVSKKINENPDLIAEDICELSTEIRLVDYHIGGYNLLRDTASVISVTDNHNLRKFLLGLSHLFFDEFNRNNILISLHDIGEDFLCSFEYETFNIAIHNFLQNAAKYAKPYSKISVYTKPRSGELIFDMESIKIDKDEIRRLYERGMCGRWVPADMKGSGIGMYLIKKALDRSNIKLSILSDPFSGSEVNGVKYCKNTFSFSFAKYNYQN